MYSNTNLVLPNELIVSYGIAKPIREIVSNKGESNVPLFNYLTTNELI